VVFEGIRTHIVFIQRVWQAVAGVVTLLFIASYLSALEQGYYYTLASIAALYMAFDMGLSGVLVQFAARYFIGHSWGRYGEIIDVAHSPIHGLVRLSLQWYSLAALSFLLLYPIGIFFIRGGASEFLPDWRGPWVLLVIATAINLLFLPIFSIIEGSGEILEVYAVRLAQGVLGSLLTWLVLATDWKVYSVAMQAIGSASISVAWLIFHKRGMILQLFKNKNCVLNWRLEIWPLQWRSAMSWLAGYVLILLHVPLLFQAKGPVVAGQMGLTMTVVNMLSMLSMSWVTAQLPAMGRAVAIKDWILLDDIFGRAFRLSSYAFVFGAIVFGVFRLCLDLTPYGMRFLSVSETVVLLIAMAFYHLTAMLAAYLRSHLIEPFLWLSIVGSILTALFAIWAAPIWGAAGVVVVLLVVNGLFFLPIVLGMWLHYRRKWHLQGS